MSHIGFDTNLAAHLLDEQRPLNLLDQATVALGVSNWGKGIFAWGEQYGEPHTILARNQAVKVRREKRFLSDLWGDEGMGYYNARDVAYSHMLYEKQKEQIVADQGLAKLLKYLVLPAAEAYVQIELNGIWVDSERLDIREKVLEEKRRSLSHELRSKHIDRELYAEWDAARIKKKQVKPLLGNDNFLRAWIYLDPRGLLLPVTTKTPTGLAKVDEATLADLKHPSLEVLAEYRSVNKSLSFFEQWREWMGDDGRLHPSFNLTGTKTGRRSCTNPNLQQTPRWDYIRSCLGAPPGWLFLEVDYSQLEVRIAAWFANEETMLRLFEEGVDIYRYFAAKALGIPMEEVTKDQRQKAKAAVLGFLYGMGHKKFAVYAHDNYGVEFTPEESEEFRNAYFRLFPGLVAWHERMRYIVNRDKKVRTVTGRWRHLNDIDSDSNMERGKSERISINSPVQGSGGDFTLSGIVEIMGLVPGYEGLDMSRVIPVGEVHDSALFQVRADYWVEDAKRIMQIFEEPAIIHKYLGIDVPIRMKVEGNIGTHWGNKQYEFSLDNIDDMVAAGINIVREAA